MSTKGIISRVLPRCPGWSRSSGNKSLLKLLEQGVDELFEYDHDSMIYRGTDNNGLPPYLTTVAGTYDYSVVAANLSCGAITRVINGTTFTLVARKVKGVYVDESLSTLVTEYPYQEDKYQRTNFNTAITTVVVASQPAYENTPPTLKFQYDPGSYSDRYFIEFYVGAPRMTSENIQIPMPERFEKYLEEYIYLCANERVGEALQFLEDYVKPKFHASVGTAANTSRTSTPPNLI